MNGRSKYKSKREREQAYIANYFKYQKKSNFGHTFGHKKSNFSHNWHVVKWGQLIEWLTISHGIPGGQFMATKNRYT